MSKIRVVTLGLAAIVILAWAAPAFAQHSKTTATSITVTAGKPTEFKFTLSKMSAAKGTVTFHVTNKGALSHDFSINGKTSGLLATGKSKTMTVTFAKAGKYAYKCTVAGHAQAGMKGTLTVM